MAQRKILGEQIEQSTLDQVVPYSGAIDNVDLGSNALTVLAINAGTSTTGVYPALSIDGSDSSAISSQVGGNVVIKSGAGGSGAAYGDIIISAALNDSEDYPGKITLFADDINLTANRILLASSSGNNTMVFADASGNVTWKKIVNTSVIASPPGDPFVGQLWLATNANSSVGALCFWNGTTWIDTRTGAFPVV